MASADKQIGTAFKVGKTHLVTRYTRGTLPESSNATIGIEFAVKEVQMDDGTYVRAMIWDTAGQERYKSVTQVHYRRAEGALLVYDITKKQSFVNAAKWADDLMRSAEADVIVCLVGNKVDLEAEREVPTESAAQFAKRNNYLFFETSSVSGHNVREAFEALIKKVYQRPNKTLPHPPGGSGPGMSWVGHPDRKSYLKNYNKDMGGLKLTDGPAQNKKAISCCGDEDEA